MGIGEAFVTCLNEKGIPTPLVRTLLRAPISRMDTLSGLELKGLIASSTLAEKYNKEVDRESAYEILTTKMERAAKEEKQKELREQQEKAAKATRRNSRSRRAKEPDSFLEELSKNTMVRQVGRTIFRELTRGLLGALGGK